MNTTKHMKKSKVVFFAIVVSLLTVNNALIADDTEIFFGAEKQADTFPNVLFVFDTSGSMRSRDGTPHRRIDRMKTAVNSILDSVTNVNVGMMRFNGTRGGGAVVYPVSYINEQICPGNICNEGVTYPTTRDRLREILQEMEVYGGTPVVGSLYEASRYFRGEGVDYGKKRGKRYRNGYHRISHTDSFVGGSIYTPSDCNLANNPNDWRCKYQRIDDNPVYTSPITSECQSNHIVLLSDGYPSSDESALENNIESMIGSQCGNNSSSKKCGTELTFYLRNTDQNGTLPQTQNITTHTIGFNFTSQWMKDLADNGGGSYYEASDADDLLQAFSSIFDVVADTETTFVAPASSVNQFNKLTNRNDIYFSLFKPLETPTWEGNLKRYHLEGNPAQLVDVNGHPAIDPDTGFFKDTAKSFWSDIIDGDDVALGGAASQLTLTNRKVYTNVGSSSELSHVSNRLHESNTLLTKQLFDINNSPNAYFEDLVRWSRGMDTKDVDDDDDYTDIRNHMGDPLHSQPLMINYDNGKSIVYISTNEGFLHAIDSATGEEQFAFIPKELLKNLSKFYENSDSVAHPYGLDGPISLWQDPGSDTKLLIVSMRRGGRSYYAIDVTNVDTPKLAWTINGNTSTGFNKLGQSWSRAFPSKVSINGQDKEVLVFAGGYDAAQDSVTVRSTDTMGNAIYMVDAATGALIWSAGDTGSGASETFSRMDYSIPSDLALVDIDFDGRLDMLFVGDMGGQVWRFDINDNATSATDLVDGGVIADLSGSNTSENRRFFYAPDISIINQSGQATLAVAIGSGWRSHPLDRVVDDRFYMLKSDAIYSAPEGYGIESSGRYIPITESDLLDITNDLNPDMSSYVGWMLRLEDPGEKVLASSVTLANQVVFTTYKPAESAGACSVAQGAGAVYVVDIVDGSPVPDRVGQNNEPSKEDRTDDLNTAGIPPEAVILFPGDVNNPNESTDAEPVVLVGPNKIDLSIGTLTERTFWQYDPQGTN